MNPKNHPLIKTLATLGGNSGACVYTEPMWSIPHNLFTPFASVYMAALLLSDSQIGIVASVSMLFRAVFALLGGAFTDKLGRKRATLIFDCLSWSLPCLLWALSQDFWWFMIAAAFNGMMSVTENSWTCLLVEDAKKSEMVKIYSLIHISGQLAVIFAPLAALLINHFSIVPVMRVIYLFSFLSMTMKFFILNKYCVETEVGKKRKSETSDMPIIKILSGYGKVFRRVASSKAMMFALAIYAVFSITTMITVNFFGLYATGNLMIPEHFLGYYPIVRSAVVILFLFAIHPALGRFGYKLPIMAGILFYAAGHAVLLAAPAENLLMTFVYIFLEACAFSLVMPYRDSIVALLIDPDERARISSIINVLTLSCCVPFGYLAGRLSDMDRRLPFALDIALFAVAFTLVLASRKLLVKGK